MGPRRHYSLLLDKRGRRIKERSNTDGDPQLGIGHAEERVLRNQPRNVTAGGTLIIARTAICTTHQNSWVEERNSKPCDCCMRRCVAAMLKYIIYTTNSNGCWEYMRLY